MFYRKILKDLETWRNSEIRKPLIIRGARQVGKTTIVHEFGKQFKQYIYVNLEKKNYQAIFKTYEDIHKITEQIFFQEGKKLSLLKDTLLFIDEIQEVPTAINFLRYFKEELPELPVIAAGSMLETLLEKNITFPVGRVEYRILRPVSFEEFLGAIDEEMALEQLKHVPLNEYAHQKLLTLFQTYALIGGMPEVVNHYAKYRDITALKKIYQSLLNSYLEDAEKYSKSTKQLQLIRFTINQSLFHAGKRITFEGFGNGKYKSREIGETLRTLQKTHLIHLIYPTVSTTIPAIEDSKKSPRLQFLDTGLLNHFVGLQHEIVSKEDLNTVYQGTMIEHLVGQEILSYQTFPLDKLHYWVRQKNSSSAEVDYIYPYEGKIIPIEVKSGTIGKIKSLQIFINESPINYGIRYYAGKLSIDTLRTSEGKDFFLLNLPYFLGSQLETYVKWFQLEVKRLTPPSNAMTLCEPIAPYGKEKIAKTITLKSEELPKIYKKIIQFCSDQPRTGREIIENLLYLTYQSRNKRTYIKPLIELEILTYTNKTNLKTRDQSYVTTEKGRNLIKFTEKLI